MKSYKGFNDCAERRIEVTGNTAKFSTYYRLLKHIVRHSPTGFNWGYAGSGPADTALSILTDCLGTDRAEIHYRAFKHDFVSRFANKPGSTWEITERQIIEWVDIQEGTTIGVVK